ncbi:MAG: hypothetical protein J5I59_00890 [Saprospiraceae bacterium]|nr:hypothetical protein [Saprospiraceae bacterium]
MKKLLILCLISIGFIACKKDSTTTNNQTTQQDAESPAFDDTIRTIATLTPAAGSDEKVTLSTRPVFQSPEAEKFASDYDSFLSLYRTVASGRNPETLSQLLDKYLELSSRAASVKGKLSGEELSSFNKYLEARQKEYATLVAGGVPK